jgi:hypothetical protein
MSEDTPDSEGSATDVEQSTERARRLDRSVYKRAFYPPGVEEAGFDTASVMVDSPVAHELHDLCHTLPCETKGDVIEYLLAYWASEGRLEEDYDYVGSETKESGREHTLATRNL